MQCSEHEKLYPLILAVVRHTSLHILSIFFAAHQTALRLRVVVENQCAFSASRDDVIAQLSGRSNHLSGDRARQSRWWPAEQRPANFISFHFRIPSLICQLQSRRSAECDVSCAAACARYKTSNWPPAAHREDVRSALCDSGRLIPAQTEQIVVIILFIPNSRRTNVFHALAIEQCCYCIST